MECPKRHFALGMLCKAGSAGEVQRRPEAIAFRTLFVYFHIDPSLKAISSSPEPR